MEVSEFNSTVDSMHKEAERRGLFFQVARDSELEGRKLSLDQEELVGFTSCSYLGLEYHPEMIKGVQEAVARYGTQFSASRAYVSAPDYLRLESTLDKIFGGHTLVTSSTTMAHQAALPVLATEKDAVVYDHQVHHSVQVALTLCRANGTAVEMVRHRELERSLEVVKRLANKHRTVWFAGDGVYSMFGDLAPFNLLQEVLNVAPNVRLYIDDAHGMSWAGQYGRGRFLAQMPLDERIVIATSFAKAFAAGGGCLAFSSKEERDLVHRAGAAQLFNGPMQPPMLGAALASARVHTSPELGERQLELKRKVHLTNRLLKQVELPLLAENETPIFFIAMGRPDTAFEVAQRMKEDGFYVNISMYPTVPLKRSGIRLAITSIHSGEEVKNAVESMAYHFPKVLAEQGISYAELMGAFEGAVPEESRESEWLQKDLDYISDAGTEGSSVELYSGETEDLSLGFPRETFVSIESKSTEPASLQIEHYESVEELNAEEWNQMLGGVGTISWESLKTAEKVFTNLKDEKLKWTFHYLLVRDEEKNVVAATVFTELLHKNDMLMRPEVSVEIEKRREADPYFLTTRALAMGTYISEGEHLFLDEDGPWQKALNMLLAKAERIYEEKNLGAIILRDFTNTTPELEQSLIPRGYIKMPGLPTHVIDIRGWSTPEEYVKQLDSNRKRRRMKKRLAASTEYRRAVYSQVSGNTPTEEEIDRMYELYLGVAQRKFALNIFPYPREFFVEMLSSKPWEIITLEKKGASEGSADSIIGFYAGHLHRKDYAPLLVGLDYNYIEGEEYGVYRQLLLQIILRAKELGADLVHMGMDADFEKQLLGSKEVSTSVFVQMREHFEGAVLQEIVEKVGLER